MRPIALLAISLVEYAAAETVTSMFLPGFDPQPLVGSVKGYSGSTTTYAINCRPGTDGTDCGVPMGGLVITQAPDYAGFNVEGKDNSISVNLSCDLHNIKSVSCVETIAGSEANDPGTSSGVFTGDEVSSMFLPVTITAGDAAVTGASASGSTASVTAAATTDASSVGTSASSRMTSVASTASSTASSSTLLASQSTGGAPQVTGAIGWGAAAALALAAL